MRTAMSAQLVAQGQDSFAASSAKETWLTSCYVVSASA
jgi:hypothetical protein